MNFDPETAYGREQIQHAANALREGGVIAYPTESSFGLGCDPDNEKALQRLLTIKRRPASKGLIILVSQLAQAEPYIEALDASQRSKIMASRQRATTWLIPRKSSVSPLLCGDHNQLAVRLTSHAIAKALCEAFVGAIVSTSCNLAGQAPLSDDCAVKVQMGDQLDFILGGRVGGEPASQIIDITSGAILRS